MLAIAVFLREAKTSQADRKTPIWPMEPVRICAMTFLFVLMIGGFALAAATALVRGLMAFLRDSEHLRSKDGAPREGYGLQQNRMMTQRVLYQGIAILLVALLGAVASQR
jgi:hypothetical protein